MEIRRIWVKVIMLLISLMVIFALWALLQTDLAGTAGKMFAKIFGGF